MATDIRIRRKPGKWSIRAGGAVLGESSAALELSEAGLPDMLYFPREDLAMALMEPSPTRSTCPKKGEAVYFSIHTESGVIADAGWSYEDPIPEAAEIAGHIAFYPDKVTVEQT
jgi:uncharacterized protein (DUF427 family)